MNNSERSTSRVAQSASLFGNHLEVLLLPQRPRWYYLAAFLADLGGTLPQFPGVRYYRTDRLRVTAMGQPVGFEVDGEWIGNLAVEARGS